MLRKIIKFYKEEKRKEKEMKQLLETNLDYVLLQKLINECGTKGIKVEIRLKSGDNILIRKEEKEVNVYNDYIDGLEDEVIIK